MDAAARHLDVAGFAYAGLVCIHPQRLIVHDRVYNQFKATFLEAISKLKIGDPLDDTTDVGPLINDAGAQRLNAWVDEAVNLGGTLLAGGHAEGRMMPPTVLENVPERAQLVCNEAFGPVVVLQRASNWTDAINTANRSQFGLQTGVFSTHLPHVLQAARDIEAGGVIVNDTSAFRVDQMPYGGVKNSGVGREGARAALEELTYVKSVVLR